MCQRKTDLAKSQGGYFDLHAENTIDFNSILTDNVDRQSINNESPVIHTIKKFFL
jgi:hypothetical protein